MNSKDVVIAIREIERLEKTYGANAKFVLLVSTDNEPCAVIHSPMNWPVAIKMLTQAINKLVGIDEVS